MSMNTTTEQYLNACYDFESLKKSIEKQIDASLPNLDSYLQFFSDYVEFNYVFAGCVASLSGKFHISPSIERCPVLHNTSHFVAQNIFEAAIDEYKGITHKEMSLFLMDNINKFFNVSSCEPTDSLKGILSDVTKGYGVDRGEVSGSLFDELAVNLGFHIASEKLASYEFSYLDTKTYAEHKDLHEYLNSAARRKPWSWVEIHGEVEEEHADFAFKASDLILHELRGNARIKFLDNVKKGFNKFVEVQTNFFSIKRT